MSNTFIFSQAQTASSLEKTIYYCCMPTPNEAPDFQRFM